MPPSTEAAESSPQTTTGTEIENPSTASQSVYYFFYGTLTRPAQLKFTLGLPDDEEPTLHKAHIFGYQLAWWGRYPALIPGEKEDMISGYAYLVMSIGHEERLAQYETNAYKTENCRIYFSDSSATVSQVEGKVFVYAGNPDALSK